MSLEFNFFEPARPKSCPSHPSRRDRSGGNSGNSGNFSAAWESRCEYFCRRLVASATLPTEKAVPKLGNKGSRREQTLQERMCNTVHCAGFSDETISAPGPICPLVWDGWPVRRSPIPIFDL
jgi:hypothetical protein